jgi:hypothetical protein
MALDNDNSKTSEETDEWTDDLKTEVPKDEDMEDDSLCVSQQEGDVDFGDYIEVFVSITSQRKRK